MVLWDPHYCYPHRRWQRKWPWRGAGQAAVAVRKYYSRRRRFNVDLWNILWNTAWAQECYTLVAIRFSNSRHPTNDFMCSCYSQSVHQWLRNMNESHSLIPTKATLSTQPIIPFYFRKTRWRSISMPVKHYQEARIVRSCSLIRSCQGELKHGNRAICMWN